MNEDMDLFENIMTEQHDANYESDPEFFEKVMTEQHDANYEADPEFFEKVMAGEQTKEKEPDSDPDFFRTLAMTRDEVIAEVKKDGGFLEKVAGRYGNDPEIVVLAVDNNANAYAFASKRLQENRELAQFLVDNKNIDLKKAKSKKDEKGNVDVALITTLQEQIEIIKAVHRKAIEEKYKAQYHGQELTM